MPTNITKAAYSNTTAPAPTDADMGEIEVEIVDPEQVIEEVAEEVKDANAFNQNLAEELDETTLDALAEELCTEIQEDLNSRKEWEQTYNQGLELLGLKIENRTEPWNGACGVFHPLLAEAAVRFQAETIMETFPAAGPVKTKILGKITKRKEEAAQRVKDDMNHQLTDVMPDYRAEHERLLWALPIAGSAFKKVYFDPSLERQVAMFVPAEDLIVPYGAATLDQAPRITQRMKKTKNDLKKLQLAGFYREVDLGDPQQQINTTQQAKDKQAGVEAIKDNRFTVYEVHADLLLKNFKDKFADNEKTEIEVPYVVSINLSNKKILAIYRNWRSDDETKARRVHFVHYGYVPGFGFYHLGLVHLVGGFAKSATSLLRQLVDAGTLSNLPGGLKARGLRIKGDDTPIRPGEWRDVDIPGGKIGENVMPLPYKEPSATLYQLFNTIVEEGRRMMSMTDLKTQDINNESPVGTTLAMLERQLKILTAVQARVHAAMKVEFKLLRDIIKENAPKIYDYDPDGDEANGDQRAVKQEDYDLVEVIPVSDPNASTMSQRIVQYQAAFQLANTAPNIYDMPELHQQMLETMGFKNIGKIIPSAEEQKPKDPASENMALLIMKPVKVFINQDHESHIAAHMAAARDPLITQLIGQSPNAAAIQAAFSAHVTEHVAYRYRKGIEEMLGASLPAPDAVLPEEIEASLSKAIAAAADKLLGRDQMLAQAQKVLQDQNDPLVQLQMKELAIKEREVERKEKKDQADTIIAAEELKMKDMETRTDVAIDQAKLVVDVKLKEADLQMKETDREIKKDEITLKRMDMEARQQNENNKLAASQEADTKKISADLYKTERGHQEARASEERQRLHEGQMREREHQQSLETSDKTHEQTLEKGDRDAKNKIQVEKSKPKPKPAAKGKK